MRTIVATLCMLLAVTFAVPVHAADEDDVDRDGYSSYSRLPQMKRKSVATAALLSVVPAFGAGLYYVEEYPMAISSTIGMATGVAFILDSAFRSHKSSVMISGITIAGTAWLLGVIYAPISAHQRNKVIDETYGFTPYLDVSHEKLYAGINMTF